MEPGAWLSTLSPRDVRLVTNSRCPLEPTTQRRSLADLPLIFFKERPQIERGMRLPSTYGFREFCDAGGLLCCGSNLQVQFGRFRYFIDKILKGTKAPCQI
jgi:hypothetical protein